MNSVQAARMVSILVPVYNNELYLCELCARLRTVLEGDNREFEIILVNDGSSDESWKVICDLAINDVRIKGLMLSRNFGQHAAISAALEHATGENFILMDADLQDRPEMIPILLRKLSDGGHDIVYTIKIGDKDSLFRRLTSLTFHGLVSSATKTISAANIGTFRAFDGKIARALLDYRERGVVYGPLMHTLGYDIAFVPVQRDQRIGSRSSYSFAKRLALAFQSIVSYSTLPQRSLLWAGGLVCISSLGYLAIIVLQHFLGGKSLAEGLTLLVTLMLFLIGVIMLALGVLASYLFLIYKEVLSRPRYHIQDTRNLGEHK